MLKIDRAFTSGIEQRPESLAVVRAVTDMCNSLGIGSTAEGVETIAQLGLLGIERCDEVQGYLFSEPKPERDLHGVLASCNLVDVVPTGMRSGKRDADEAQVMAVSFAEG